MAKVDPAHSAASDAPYTAHLHLVSYSSEILPAFRMSRTRSRSNQELLLRTACDRCHAQKVKCCGASALHQPGHPEIPCERCFKFDSACYFSLKRPTGRPFSLNPKRKSRAAARDAATSAQETQAEEDKINETRIIDAYVSIPREVICLAKKKLRCWASSPSLLTPFKVTDDLEVSGWHPHIIAKRSILLSNFIQLKDKAFLHPTAEPQLSVPSSSSIDVSQTLQGAAESTSTASEEKAIKRSTYKYFSPFLLVQISELFSRISQTSRNSSSFVRPQKKPPIGSDEPLDQVIKFSDELVSLVPECASGNIISQHSRDTSGPKSSDSNVRSSSNQEWQTSTSFAPTPTSAADSLQHVIIGMLFGSYAQILQLIDSIIDGLVLRREPIARTRNINAGLSEAQAIEKLVHALGAMHQAVAPFYTHGHEVRDSGKEKIISEDPSIMENLSALGFGLAETKEQEQRLLDRLQHLTWTATT